MDTYYFWIEETDKHDKELEMIEANNLEHAKKLFIGMHPEDVKHIESISLENQFMPLWQKEE